MKEKKEEYRFTIQFNPADPSHQQVAGILNRQGRRKAQYLVNAVCTYENGTGLTLAESAPVNYQMIENIVDQILTSKSLPQKQPVSPAAKGIEMETYLLERIDFEESILDTPGENSLSAITESIEAFRKKK
ncbi:hypothetical protein [Anaerocolumna xylanovorans]|nr:hypothetical protein [Anaerocolumna xylanovorans]